MSNNWKFTTKQIHSGQAPDPTYGSQTLPIHQSTAFVFKDSEEAAGRFALSTPGMIYSRITNPTVGAVETKIAALEGGTSALLLSSGQAAITYSILNIARSGDHIVASGSLYGGTSNLFKVTLAALGIDTTFVDNPNDPAAWDAATQDNTVAYFGETIPNPKGDILDVEPIAELAHSKNLPLIVDNTVPSPYLLRPIEFGADVVVHSATKYLGGHGTTLGGVIIESGQFDWRSAFPAQFAQPDESYHGLIWGDLGGGAFTTRVRAVLLRDTGASLSAIDAWILNLGLETLSLRMDRHVSNATAVAEFLEGQEAVEKVSYASLPSSQYYQLAAKYVPQGAAGLLSFDLKGGRAAGEAFVNALELHSHVANLGDVRSLVVHPASTTHSQSDDAGLLAAGITQGTVRLSVGLEDIDDIIADLKKGLEAAAVV